MSWSVVLVSATIFVQSLAFSDFPSYEDRLTFKVYPQGLQNKNVTKALSELKLLVNNALDAEFLKNMAESGDRDSLGLSSGLFAENYTVSETCRSQLNHTINGLINGEFWALKMLDASAKIDSGILEGNTIWLGSYDECFQIDETLPGMPPSNSGMQTHFCAVEIPIKIAYIPLTVYVAVCIPKECSTEDLKYLANELFSMIEKLLQIKNSIRITNAFCKAVPEIDTRAVVAIVILGIFAALLVVSTLYDIIFIQWPTKRDQTLQEHASTNDEKTPLLHERENLVPKNESILQKLLLSFSLYSNGKKILQVNQSAGTLTAVNGIRFLSISWVVLGHSFVFTITNFRNYYTAAPKFMKRWSFQAVLNALVSVDSFFALSGLLVAYLTLREMKKGKGFFRINWFTFYFHRFWRLTPVYMLLLMISACLSRYFGDGPLWPEQGFEKDYCENTWWRNLLYINNLYNTEPCFGVSWYLANDMQFFVLSPLMLIPLYFYYPLGIGVCFVWLLGSAITPGVVSSVLDLPPSSAGGGGSPEGRADYMSDYYIRPYCRMGPYIVGIIVGSLLYKTDCKVKINKYLNLLLWFIFATLAILVLYGLRDAFVYPEDALNRDVSALYNATHKIVWGACVCWVIFACATGNGGFVNTLLSWSAFVPLARLSYCIYLTHPFIMSTYSGTQRTQLYLDDFNIVNIFLGHLVLSTMSAFVASLSFEAPMMGLEKVILKRQRAQ
ncbi:nose resistant to fluoxetine protein 6-like [Saccostrea echinata]|uniref:nose resistant to fluoxetine protein 6-like n=1 Tax=Saccostrea echinata TaxID=191078 RepID=UPI002A8302BC|nr:nose resistant to fluoxetine protein 6-like [Saccostrea echinata]